MDASYEALNRVVDLLGSPSPTPSPTPSPLQGWDNVYSRHTVANLLLPAVSVEVETNTALLNDKAIRATELIDNRLIRLSIKVHTGYRLGIIDTSSNLLLADEVIRRLRQNVDLGDGYRIFDVTGVAYNVEHTSSGTTGVELLVDIHKVEYYEQ